MSTLSLQKFFLSQRAQFDFPFLLRNNEFERLILPLPIS